MNVLVTSTMPDELRSARSIHDLVFGIARERGVEAIVHDSADAEVTRQLILACERQPTIRRFVYRSSGNIYARTAMEPNLLDEDAPVDLTSSGHVAADLTVCSRMSMSRLSIAVLRCAEVLAPGGQLWDYLQSRVCFRPLGFDPMLNVLSSDDRDRALRLAAHSDARGVFNIPGGDTLPLSRLISLVGRRGIPVPGPLLAPLYMMRARLVGFEFRYDLNMRRFHFGGILDGTRARRLLGYEACGRSPSPSSLRRAATFSQPSKTSAT